MVLKENDTAPNLDVTFHDGSRDSLIPKDNGFKYVVLYFFPRAFTSGCTRETRGFVKVYSSLKENGVEIIGVSSDSLSRQKKFAEKLDVPFKLVADPEMNVIKAYDAMGKTGKSAARVTYIIEVSSKKIVKVFSGLKKAEDHVNKVLQFFNGNI
jgi:peroxiredoxin Q/BCP